ncbi:AraC family transcriptional regulator [Paenibacillus sp. J5C_2022]|uniref:helix-turn-helix transcriptional regulator n=1 Tax=Paenibacillus sp. J5C2022 TaxID=2977129 RepID=UPI0021CDF794|nr:helix-turn-helix domain-containing protein [Paenibacillus sp. J5C2022]MCU6709088.1 AraC family transcriptional regulator [Paenibacillus sp. J5C2022]
MIVKRKFLYKMLTLFIVIVLLYSIITSSIIFYKSYQMLDAQNNHSYQLYTDQAGNYADFKIQTAMEFVYKISTLQSLIDYRYSDDTNYLTIANLYNDLIEQLHGFGQLGFTLGITKLTDDMIITGAGTFSVDHYFKELGIRPAALDRFEESQHEALAADTYVIPQSLATKPDKIVMIHRTVHSRLAPLYFFIVVDSDSLLPKSADNPEGNFYLFTDELVASYGEHNGLNENLLTMDDGMNAQMDHNPVRWGSTIHYVHHSKLVPNLKYVYSSELTSFGTIFAALWKTALFPGMLLLLFGVILAYMATRSSYKPIRQLLQFLDERNKAHGDQINQIHELAYIQSSIEQVYSLNHSLQNKLEHSVAHLREDFFRKVIYGIASERFIQDNIKTLNLEVYEDRLNLMLLECEGLEAHTIPAPHLSATFHDRVEEKLGKEEPFFVLPLDRNKYCILFRTLDSDRLREIAEHIIHRIESILSLDITICISEAYPLTELTSGLQELLRLGNHQYAAVNKVMTSREAGYAEEAVCYYPLEIESFLINYVSTNELGKAYELLGNLIEENEKQAKLAPANLSSLKHSLLTTFKRCLNTNNKTLNQFVKEYPNALEEFMDVGAAAFSEKAIGLFEHIFNYCNKDKFSLDSSTASRIFIYIHKHFDKDLSLTDIASHFNLSESYVSKLLKNSLDINFKQYVNTLKAKRAKELLNQKTYKVHEVASIVGCNNTNTFIRIFKQYIGVSPGEYLKSLE